MLKLAQTNQQTNRQTGQKQYVPHYYIKVRLGDMGGMYDRMILKNQPVMDENTDGRTNKLADRKNDYSHASYIKISGIGFHVTRRNAQPYCSHAFQWNETIFKLKQDIRRINALTKFHVDAQKCDYWSVHLSHRGKTALHPGSHVFYWTRTIQKLCQEIIRIKCSEEENVPAPVGHVFQQTGTIFKHWRDIVIMF
ncbi:hypothetical protein DPMN_117220 [Dreissena polymorpha]|uniref:Uncharacterized protein n=1 Tax=Dreissena polymorpha TaxID=45954 RepID=A0A9D4QV01_DREPO|nr:hypothetical protein DPMN_117220 [Dreissena polymorpha]